MTLTVVHPVAPTVRVGPSLAAVVRLERTRTIVVLEGDADLSTREILCEVLSRVIATWEGGVVMDLSELASIDSGSVRIFAQSREWLKRQGRPLSFRAPSRLATLVLHVWGLAGLIESQDVVQV